MFLTEETKKGFEKRKKELKKFFGNYIRVYKNLSKKYYDGIASKNPISLYPNDKPYSEIKISSILKKFYISTDGKFSKYYEIFAKLLKLQKEYSKHLEKSLSYHERFRDIFRELKNESVKFNTSKPTK